MTTLNVNKLQNNLMPPVSVSISTYVFHIILLCSVMLLNINCILILHNAFYFFLNVDKYSIYFNEINIQRNCIDHPASSLLFRKKLQRAYSISYFSRFSRSFPFPITEWLRLLSSLLDTHVRFSEIGNPLAQESKAWLLDKK